MVHGMLLNAHIFFMLVTTVKENNVESTGSHCETYNIYNGGKLDMSSVFCLGGLGVCTNVVK